MKSFEGIQNLWKGNKDQHEGTEQVNKKSFQKTISSRIRKEKKTLIKYFWGSFVYQILIYSFMSHLFIRHWGNIPIMAMAVAAISLYIPFTSVMVKKFKTMYAERLRNENSVTMDMHNHVLNQYNLLSEFYRFKKRFDWLGVPVSCVIIVLVIFQLYTPGGVVENIIPASVLFVVWITMFITAIHFENAKKFREPLRQMGSILEDMKDLGTGRTEMRHN